MAALPASLFLHLAGRLLAAPNETKYSPNYLFTSGVKIKPADRGSLATCNPELQFVYFVKGLSVFQVHKFLAVNGGGKTN